MFLVRKGKVHIKVITGGHVINCIDIRKYIYIYIYIYIATCKSFYIYLPWGGGGGGDVMAQQGVQG